MKVTNIIPAVGFALCANAFAVENRAVANNNCGRAVAGTAKGPIFMASVRKDCSNNVIATEILVVTPIPSTFIQTSVVQTSVTSLVLTTSLSSSLTTTTSLATKTQTSLATEYSTSYKNEISSIAIPYTVLEPSLATITVTSAVSAITVAPVKRDSNHAVRAISSTSKTIPAYASPCKDFAEYAAACSYAGVIPGPTTVYTTLPAITLTSIQLVTSTSVILATQLVISEIDITISEASTATTVQSLTETIATVLTSTQTSLSTYTAGTLTIPSFTTVTVAPSPPVSTNILLNGGFEGETAPWSVQLSYPTDITYNLQYTSIPGHTGRKTGTIKYIRGSFGAQTWFNQPITVIPKTVYNLKAFMRSSINGPSCEVTFFVANRNGFGVIYTISTTPSDFIGTAWREASGTWTAPQTLTDYSLNVRLTCGSYISGDQTYYFDDISFTATS